MNNKIECVSFSIIKSEDVSTIIDNCVTVGMNIDGAIIVVYIHESVKIAPEQYEFFVDNGVVLIASSNPILDQFIAMNGNGVHDNFIIQVTPTPIDIFSIRKWLDSDKDYMIIDNGYSFVFGGRCSSNTNDEFCNWYEKYKGVSAKDFFDEHIRNHISHSVYVCKVHNVASYSLWGTDLLYLDGAKYNAKLVKEFYPEWECRMYVDSSITNELINELSDLGAILYYRDETDGSSGMLWRFEAMFDDTIDYFIIRDADSRITYREKLAVDEWVNSGKGFHVMRDNPGHGTSILGGMWGGRTQLCKKYKYVFETEVFKAHKGYDQEFLTRYLWRDVRENMICHRSHYFRGYATEYDVDFPIPLELNHYVGAVVPYEESGENWYAEYR